MILITGKHKLPNIVLKNSDIIKNELNKQLDDWYNINQKDIEHYGKDSKECMFSQGVLTGLRSSLCIIETYNKE